MTYKRSLVLSFLIATVLIMAVFRVLKFHQEIGLGQGAPPSPLGFGKPLLLVPDSPVEPPLGN
jgi:hypothetical protein